MGFFDKTSDLKLLVERCKRNDGAAWSALVDRFADFVYSITRRYRLTHDEAADAFQTTFQALYQSINQIENPQTLPKWLSVTASRGCQRIIRSRVSAAPLQSDDVDLTELLESEEANAMELSMRECDALAVREGLARLGGRCSQLLELIYLTEDGSYQLAAERLGMPIGAIGPTRARCLDKLRKALVEGGFFE